MLAQITMKKIFILSFIIFLFFPIAYAEKPSEIKNETSTWKIYSNHKYGYEIKYPTSLELRLTGHPDERDGKEFTIACPNLSLSSEINISIHPGKSIDEIASIYFCPSIEAKTLFERVEKINEVSENKVELNNISVNQRQGVVLTLQKTQINSFEIYLDGVRFSYMQMHGFLDDSLAKKIIATFQFINDNKLKKEGLTT